MYKVRHKKSGKVFTAKIMSKPLDEVGIVRNELKSLKICESGYIVKFYGTFET